MLPADAAQLLDLPADATPEQLEARFHELRSKLEEKIGKAPTPGLKAKYRETLDAITQAFETLTLAADSSSLPVLRRAADQPPPSASSIRPAIIEPAPAPAATPTPSGGAVGMMHLMGLVKFGFTALALFGLLGVPLNILADPQDPAWAMLLPAACGLVGLVTGIFIWRRSVRHARRRLAEGKRNRAENIVAGLLTIVGLLGTAALFLLSHQSDIDNAEAQAESTLTMIRDQQPECDREVADAALAEQTALKEMSDLEAQEQSLAAAGPARASELRDTRAMIRAYAAYLRWLGESLASHPAKPARIQLDGARTRLEQNRRDPQAAEAAREAFYAYREKADALKYSIPRRKPDPAYVTKFDGWRTAAEEGKSWAMYNLYLTYLEGKGIVEPDGPTALQWVRRAAGLSHADALERLAQHLWYGWPDVLPEDKPEGNRQYLKAAEAGSTHAMTVIGDHYRKGDHVPKDPALGFQWLQKAAAAGETNGMDYLAQCYAQGQGVAADEKMAVEWWTKAARLHHYGAQEQLKQRKLTW